MEISVKVTKFADRKFWLMYYDCPVTGKRKTRTTKQTTERKARDAASKWEDALQEGRYKPKSAVTWAEFREGFEKHLQDSPETTQAAYQTAFNALEGHVTIGKLVELTTARISHAANEWRKDGKSVATCQCYLRHLKAALAWGKKQKLLNEVPEITMPKQQKGAKAMKGRPITSEEFERMLAKVEAGLIAANSTRPGTTRKRALTKKEVQKLEDSAAVAAPSWKQFLRGLWWSGLRLGEALTLSWDDERFITVDMAGACPQLRIAAGQDKSGEERLLPLANEFIEMLRDVPKEQRTGIVFSLVGQKGEVVSDLRYVSRVISEIGKAAGVVVDKASGKFASAHDLRRAFGVRWCVRVMPAVLQAMMRHADISTTMKFYVGQGASAIQDAINSAYGRINTFVNTSANQTSADNSESSQVVSR